ncbi:CehA/McbA family metallohydrolase [Streptomyces globosus]|uniref:CehA/McbA family metallohydrolase n=1 Tax=Streptomyces globosus TaxID=68209 RepID=UPI003816D5FD
MDGSSPHPAAHRDPGPGPGRRDLLRLGTLLAAGGLAAAVPAAPARADTATGGGGEVTTTYRGHSPYGFDQWASVGFDVPDGVRRISVAAAFDPADGVLDLGMFGPTGFRGWSGGARREFTLSGSDATPGYVPGPIGAGRWSVALGPIVNDPAGMPWQISVTLHHGPPLPEVPYDVLPAAVPGRGPGWYRGDLHLHTVHSDGGRTADRLVAAARAAGMHFIATSDHNTSSTGLSWRGNVPADLLVLNAEEVTTRHGHWPAVGLPQGEWVDWRYGPADADVFDRHVRQVRGLGGLAVAAHPMTPAPGSFWEFGLDRVDALEIWNGPWTLDDAANIAVWHGLLCLGQRIAGLGNSDAHGPADAVGEPHNVVHAAGLSRPEILDALRRGRSYVAENAGVAVDFTAAAHGATAGPGEELPLALFEAVGVTAEVSGAPDAVITLHTEWGVMAVARTGGDGRGRLHWRGWGRGSLFARAEVRRLKPASTTLDRLVAATNPIWFHAAGLAPHDAGQRTLVAAVRAADGSWGRHTALPGVRGAPAFAGVGASVAGLPDGTVLTLGLGTDGGLWLTTRKPEGAPGPWHRLTGPQGQDGGAFLDAAIAGFPDGSGEIVAVAADGTLHHRRVTAAGTASGRFRPMPGDASAGGRAGGRRGAVRAAVAALPDGSAQVVAYGTDGALHHRIRRTDGTWTGWTRLPGRAGAPAFSGQALAVAGLPDGSAQVLAVGLDGTVHHRVRRPDGTWTGFRPVPGAAVPTTAAVAVGIAGLPDGSAQVAAVGRDGTARHCTRRPDGSWTAWARIPGPDGRGALRAGRIAVAPLPDGTVHLAAVATG